MSLGDGVQGTWPVEELSNRSKAGKGWMDRVRTALNTNRMTERPSRSWSRRVSTCAARSRYVLCPGASSRPARPPRTSRQGESRTPDGSGLRVVPRRGLTVSIGALQVRSSQEVGAPRAAASFEPSSSMGLPAASVGEAGHVSPGRRDWGSIASNHTPTAMRNGSTEPPRSQSPVADPSGVEGSTSDANSGLPADPSPLPTATSRPPARGRCPGESGSVMESIGADESPVDRPEGQGMSAEEEETATQAKTPDDPGNSTQPEPDSTATLAHGLCPQQVGDHLQSIATHVKVLSPLQGISPSS